MKKTIMRSVACGAAMIGAAWTLAANAGNELSLHIVRDGKGSVVQTMAVESWHYDARTRTLAVTTVGGDAYCPGAPTGKTWDGAYLRLDGSVYRLKSFSPPRGGSATLTVRPARDGVFPICSTQQRSGVSHFIAKGPNNLDVEIDLIAGGQLTRRPIPVTGSIMYYPYPGIGPEIDANLTDNLFCFESAGASGVQFHSDDTNGQPFSLKGLSAIRYRTSDKVLELETSPALTCFAPPAMPEATYLEADETGSCEQGDQIWITGFEEAENEPPSQLAQMRLDMRLQQPPATDTGEDLVYEVLVQNCTGEALENVAVRGFFPGPASGASNALEQGAPAAHDCGGLATCVNSNGYLKYLIPSLAANSTHVVEVIRPLAQGLPGGTVRLTAAAVVDPGTAEIPVHEVKSWDVPVVATNNIPPSLSGSPTTMVVDEDSNGVAAGFTLTATDEDTGFASCRNGNCVVVDSSNSSIVSTTGVDASFDIATGAVGLTVTPAANAFGNVTLSVSVTDDAGAVSNVIQVPVTVTAVNDPPTFELAEGFDRTAVSKALTINGSTYCGLNQTSPNGAFVLADATCPTQAWEASPVFPNNSLIFNEWIRNVSPGPNESGTATINVTVDNNAQGIIGNWVYDQSTRQLQYELSDGAKGTAQLRVTADDGSAQTSVLVTVTVENASPAITSNGGGATASVSFDENATSVVTTVTATDSDDGPSAITYGKFTGPGAGPDAGLFAIDAVTGELTFVAAPDFEAPTDADQDNVYEVTVTASDGSGGSDSQTISVTVADIDEQPVIVAGQSSFAVATSAAEDDVVVAASNFGGSFDPEGATLTNWRIISGNVKTDTGAVKPFKINNVSGEIAVNDPSNFLSTATTSFTLQLVVSDAVSGGLDSDPVELVIQVQ